MSDKSIFVNAADAATLENIRFGENDSAEHITTKNALLDLFFQSVRNLSPLKIYEYVEKVIMTASAAGISSNEIASDLFVLLFQSRDCRGGKGEKELFYHMFLCLSVYYPDVANCVLEFIPKYGYYKDFWGIIETIEDSKSHVDIDKHRIIDSILTIYSKQLLLDHTELTNNTESLPQISLAGKYAPRQQHQFAKKYKHVFVKFVRKYMFPGENNAMTLYRKLVSKLNAALQVTEVYMCAKRYSEIDFNRVPSLCLKRFRKAFLNELVAKHDEGRGIKKAPAPAPAPAMDEERGNRFPDDPDRVAARQHLKALITAPVSKGAPQIKAKQLMPHEIVETLLKWGRGRNSEEESKSELELLEKQWVIIKEDFVAKCGSAQKKNFIPLVDVSGSMEGTPLLVAIALGILLAETTNPAFCDRMITFSSNPEWINLESCNGLLEKVQKTRTANWNMNTNFAAAINLILDIATTNQLPANEIPDLIVFSDMQFDQADRDFKTHYDQLAEKFRAVGYDVPKIVFWNLRATEGFPVKSDTINTIMLSGFSPSLMKSFLDGEDLEKITPVKTLNKIMYDERYTPIRERVHGVFV